MRLHSIAPPAHLILLLVLSGPALFGQATPTVKQAPPPGLALTDVDSAELRAQLKSLGERIERLRRNSVGPPEQAALLPDVEVFHKAVRYALHYGEFFK